MESFEFFDRRIELTIAFDGNSYEYVQEDFLKPSLSIEFNLTMSMDQYTSSGTIVVYGLSKEVIANLATIYSASSGVFNKAKVTLKAGYKDSINTLFEGEVYKLDTNMSNPDFRVQMEVMSGYFKSTKDPQVISLKNSTLKDICDKVAKMNEMTLIIDPSLESIVIPKYSHYGTPYQHIENLRSNFKNKYYIFIDSKLLCVIPIGKAKPNSAVFELSAESGLIDTPTFSSKGAEITCLLNPYLRVGGIINLENKKVEKLNGKYVISTLEHSGGNRSPSYISKILARKM